MSCSFATLNLFAGIQKNPTFSGRAVISCLLEQKLLYYSFIYFYLAFALANTRHCLLPLGQKSASTELLFVPMVSKNYLEIPEIKNKGNLSMSHNEGQ